MIEGFTVAKAYTGINAMDTGMVLELERQIDNVTIGVDVVYNPDCEDGETPLMVSEAFRKSVPTVYFPNFGVHSYISQFFEQFEQLYLKFCLLNIGKI